jgi:hypothetical protein
MTERRRTQEGTLSGRIIRAGSIGSARIDYSQNAHTIFSSSVSEPNRQGTTLQSATNLVSLVWTTNLPAPVVTNRQYTVTDPISGTQKFFRLSQ